MHQSMHDNRGLSQNNHSPTTRHVSINDTLIEVCVNSTESFSNEKGLHPQSGFLEKYY